MSRDPRRPTGRPPGGPPKKPPPRGSGLGGPDHDEYHYQGWRDAGQGEDRPRDVVSDPNVPPPPDPATAKPSVCFVKFPAFNQVPWFGKPLIKARSSLVVPAGGIALIFDREIADRQRAVVTQLGIDVAPIAPLLNSQLEFWFQLGKEGVALPSKNVIPVWDDQNPSSYGTSHAVQFGRTTVWPGVGTPEDFQQNGLQFGVRGRAQLQGLIENRSGVDVTVRGILGFYYYWSSGPGGASEFGGGDLEF